jgi:hypothetical protein
MEGSCLWAQDAVLGQFSMSFGLYGEAEKVTYFTNLDPNPETMVAKSFKFFT